MGFNLMYTPLETIFDATMEREGRNITAYTSGNEFQAFMRRNDDGNNYEDRITLYYYTNAPVVQGSLIAYRNKVYILVNRETEENHCYYKSSALACNGMITLNNREVIGIPCYASAMKDGLAESNNMLSLINGTMEFITESNSLSRQIQIDDTFNEFGRTYKINNIYYKDGILHVITEVSTNERPIEHLKIVIDGLSKDTYSVGDTVQLSATLYINNVITNGAVTWESTDTGVASIDGTGKVTFLSDGSASFKAYWVEKDISETSAIVIAGNPNISYTYKIIGKPELTCGIRRKYTLKITDNAGNEADNVAFTWNVLADFEVEQIINGNQITLCVDNEKVIGSTFVLQVVADSKVMDEIEIRVKDEL